MAQGVAERAVCVAGAIPLWGPLSGPHSHWWTSCPVSEKLCLKNLHLSQAVQLGKLAEDTCVWLLHIGIFLQLAGQSIQETQWRGSWCVLSAACSDPLENRTQGLFQVLVPDACRQ